MIENIMLKEKIAIITGGLGFLGIEHCIAVGKLGAKVIIIDNNKKLKIEKTKILIRNNINYEYYNADISSEKSISKIFKIIIKKFKKIDILINNAAINSVPTKNKYTEFNILSWKKEIDVNLTGCFICLKIIGSNMAKNKSGIIINIASDLSVIAPNQELYKHLKYIKPPSYSASKHGIIGLTKYFASYWAKQNIRVNALSPGGIYNNQDKIFVKKIKKLIPLNRMANKNEFHGIVQFLCSEASSYLTGQNIIIDGGRSII
jgi:NAD(P)-dependent dehydrogenase (short-subunit alcohol dehydrogenase family)